MSHIIGSYLKDKKLSLSGQTGFTLVEVLVAVTILATLIGGVTLTLNPLEQINKGRDAQRQQDLVNIRTAVDAFYSDTGCYPTELPFGNEWREGSTVYMKEVPQDPACETDEVCYRYRTDSQSDCPQWNVLFAQLSNGSDLVDACPLSSLSGSECTPEGYDSETWACLISGTINCEVLANASLTGGVETVDPTPTPTNVPSATPTPTPSPTPLPDDAYYYHQLVTGAKPSIRDEWIVPRYQEVGELQTLIVGNPVSTAQITSVTARIYSDNGGKELTLSQQSGGNWSGTWLVDDTYYTNYEIEITARDADNDVETVRIVVN